MFLIWPFRLIGNVDHLFVLACVYANVSSERYDTSQSTKWTVWCCSTHQVKVGLMLLGGLREPFDASQNTAWCLSAWRWPTRVVLISERIYLPIFLIRNKLGAKRYHKLMLRLFPSIWWGISVIDIMRNVTSSFLMYWFVWIACMCPLHKCLVSFYCPVYLYTLF